MVYAGKVLLIASLISFPLVSGISDTAIVAELAKLLPRYQWLLEKKYGWIARELSRIGVMAAAADEFDNVDSHVTYTYVISLLKVDKFKEKLRKDYHCVWIVMSKFDEKSLIAMPAGFRNIVLFVSDSEVVSSYRLSPTHSAVVTRMNIPDLTASTIRRMQTLLEVDRRTMTDSVVKVGKAKEIDCNGGTALDPYGRVICNHGELMEMMGTMYNFRLNTSVLAPGTDQLYAYTFPNGSYSGLFLQLQQSSVDVSTGSFVLTQGRMQDFSFIWPTFHLRSAMFMKETYGDVNWASYYAPFHVTVWLATLTCFLLAGFLSMIVKIYHPNDVWSGTSSIFTAFQILLYQGISGMPATSVHRMIYLFLLLAVIVLMPAYSGSVISFLTVKRPQAPFTSLEKYLEDGSYQIVMLANGFVNWYLRFHISVDLSKVLVPVSEAVQSDVEGFNSACYGRKTYATLFVAFSPGLYDCHIMVLPVSLMVQYFGLAMPEHSQLKEKFSQGLSRLRSCGILHRMKLKFTSNKVHITDGPLSSVTASACIPLFMILFAGIVISAVVLFLERRWKFSRLRFLSQNH